MNPDIELADRFTSACPSIQYRVRLELMHIPAHLDEMQNLQVKLLNDPLVVSVLASQREDGWFGPRFHGYNSLESGIRILLEKGVTLQKLALIRALDALERDTELITQDLGSFGQFFDARRLGGARMIQASLLAQGGRNNHPIVTEQVEVALEGLQSVLTVDSFEEATEIKHGHLVFKAAMQWPGIYHLRLLAYTHSWRTPENKDMVTNSIVRMIQFSPMPYAHVNRGSQLIAPAAFAMDDLNPDLRALDAPGWMMWFHRTELLARMGVLENCSLMNNQTETLKALLAENNGFFKLPLRHDYFKRWGAYTGLMLEPDWKTPIRRINDLTFRSYLILNETQPQELGT